MPTAEPSCRLCQRRSQQRMMRRLERIDNRHAAPGVSMLKVFTEEHAALVIGSDGKNQRIPDWQLVIR